ncbi:hypothetical protein WICPIJ_005563 [Wickerhamomyces pijperi]|uniref:Uncharacterized protein n=1 Tax=Wickerhamomyces pijperi TaxID=599730 RepID=A0A9P8TLU4_WICPI|nr:hypothetical protein WICPIJ_005563 [Wickerhamomyces pijperi]
MAYVNTTRSVKEVFLKPKTALTDFTTNDGSLEVVLVLFVEAFGTVVVVVDHTKLNIKGVQTPQTFKPLPPSSKMFLKFSITLIFEIAKFSLVNGPICGRILTSNRSLNLGSISGSFLKTSAPNEVIVPSSNAFKRTSSSIAEPLPMLTILAPLLKSLMVSLLIKSIVSGV